MTTPIGPTIARNTLYNGAGRLWDAAAGIVLTAYIFTVLGKADYGLWAVAGALTGYAALLDFGMGSAYARFIAEHAARNEQGGISSVVSVGFWFYFLFGLVFVAVLWPCVGWFVPWVIDLYADPGHLADAQVRDDLVFLLRGSLVLFAVSNCIAPFTAVQTGLQRMGVSNLISFAVSLVKIAATVAFLEAGYGIRGLLFANAIVLGVFGVISVITAFILVPRLSVSPFQLSKDTFRALFAFGWRAQVARLSNLVMFETDVLVITFFLRDLELAGLYRIGVELANKMRQVPAVLLSALVPAASFLDALGEQEKLQRLYRVATKYVALVAFPLAFFLFGAADLTLGAWIGTGTDLAVAVIVLRIMALGYLANILPGAGVTVALGMNRPDLQMRAGLISMTANIVLTIALVLTLGFYGIPIATALSMLISWAWFARAMARLLDAPPRSLLRNAVLWPAVAALPGAAIGAFADWQWADLSGRGPNAAALLILFTVFTAIYIAIIRSGDFIDAFDRKTIVNSLESFGLIRRKNGA